MLTLKNILGLLLKTGLALTAMTSITGCSLAQQTLATATDEPLSGHCEDIGLLILEAAKANNYVIAHSNENDKTKVDAMIDDFRNALRTAGYKMNDYTASQFSSKSDFELVQNDSKAILALLDNMKTIFTPEQEPYSDYTKYSNEIIKTCSSVIDTRAPETLSGKGVSSSKSTVLAGNYQVDWTASGGCYYSARLKLVSEKFGDLLFSTDNNPKPQSGTNYVYGLAGQEYFVDIDFGGYDSSCQWTATFTPIK